MMQIAGAHGSHDLLAPPVFERLSQPAVVGGPDIMHSGQIVTHPCCSHWCTLLPKWEPPRLLVTAPG